VDRHLAFPGDAAGLADAGPEKYRQAAVVWFTRDPSARWPLRPALGWLPGKEGSPSGAFYIDLEDPGAGGARESGHPETPGR